MSATPTTTNPDWDILNSKVLASYFTAREHEVYLDSLRSMEDRRNFYPQLVGAFTELLTFLDDAASLELLDSVIFRSRKKLENVSQGLSILNYLRRANPRGVELLGLNPPVTFDSLRSAYLKAALTYHPDRGGSNEDMKLVNLAFEEFHEVISQWKAAPTTEKPTDATLACGTNGHSRDWDLCSVRIRFAADYLSWLGAVLVSVHTDSWAVDRAYSTFRFLCEHGLLSSTLAKQVNFAHPFAFALIRLATMLRTASLMDEAEYVLDCASPLTEVAKTNRYLDLTLARATARNAPDGFLKLKPAIIHPCQADNLFRLKIIDERRYREAQARFQKVQTKDESIDVDLVDFQKRGGFILLSYDAPFRCEPGEKPLVPVPGLFFWDRINLLSDEQRAEYFRAFGPSGDRVSLKHYFYQRCTGYLCSLIHSYSEEEAEKIEHECEFLQRLFPDRAFYFDQVLEISKHIRQLDPATRREKLSILRKLDMPKHPPIGPVITLSGTTMTEMRDTHIRIEPTPEYLSVVMAPVDRLRTALRTGSIYTDEEQRQTKENWNRDILFMRDLDSDRNSITARAWDAELHHRKEPEKIVKAFKPHIEQLLEAGRKIAPQNLGQLSPGYWIDGISAALAKLNRWEEAKGWLELFFSLDSHYQDRLPDSQKENMLKRLARCKAKSVG